MTMIYHQNIRNCYLSQGIMKFTTGYSVTGVNNTRSASITIYSGSQPTASTIESGWINYNTTYLLHLPSTTIQQPNASTPGTGVSIVNFGLPPTQLAANTGTATWAILWLTNIAAGTAAGQIGNTVLPSANFVILPVSNLTQTYPVRFSDTSITSGSSYTISDLNILAVGGTA